VLVCIKGTRLYVTISISSPILEGQRRREKEKKDRESEREKEARGDRVNAAQVTSHELRFALCTIVGFVLR